MPWSWSWFNDHKLRRKLKKVAHEESSSSSSMAAMIPPSLELPCFSYSDLQSATGNFSSDQKLEDGHFGEVYKGEMSDGTRLSVMKLSPKFSQLEESFTSEMSLILAAEHPNLVKLMGVCRNNGHHILLYEFVEHRTLSDILFCSGNDGSCLSWSKRYDIAIGVARGLTYLHEKAHLVHGDITAKNILLDDHLQPKIADCGLTGLLPDEDSHVNARSTGTFGYMAPEYALEGRLTEKVDVFSFGVLLLELVSGRTNLEPSLPVDRVSLLEWTWKLYAKERKVLDLIDPKLRGDYAEDEVFRLVHVALLCTQASAKSRPSMVQAHATLAGDWEIAVFPSKPGLLAELA